MQVYAFVAPKIIGGKDAPSPVGELGMVEMTQALELIDVCYEQVHVDRIIFASNDICFVKFISFCVVF